MGHAMVVGRRQLRTACPTQEGQCPKVGGHFKKFSRRYAPNFFSPLKKPCCPSSGHQTCAIWQEIDGTNIELIRSEGFVVFNVSVKGYRIGYTLVVDITFSLITCTTNIHMLMLCQHLQNYLKQQFPSLIVLPFCAHHRSIIRLDIPKNALAAGSLPQTP